ncbi:MAG TPA: HemK/PrmC family methyltransferase [Candidatus Saccharimonadales bacterium]|jgi:release factor glutamine methyltransferase
MTNGEYLNYATRLLESASIETARLDSLILMEFTLGIDRAKILAELDGKITFQQKNVLNKILSKRAKHVPISQIVHNTEFYGRSFYINRYVLEPRPESETIIDVLKSLLDTDKGLSMLDHIKIADVGTGSGALGITAYLELDNPQVDLIDIDSEALKVAKRNVVLHTIDCRVIQADLLPKKVEEYDILLCNLPYVPDDFKINLAAGHEPSIAIFGGKDGLDIYRKLFNLVTIRQHRPLYILSESLPPSHKDMVRLAGKAGYRLELTDDFIQAFKLERIQEL